MNILIYLPDINQEWGGVRQYAIGLLDLIANDNANQFYIYHNLFDKEILRAIEDNSRFRLVKDSDVDIRKPYKIKKYGIKIFNKIASKFNLRTINQKTLIDLLCNEYKIDIIHCPYQFLPDIKGVKLITTLHDVQEIHFPENFTAEERAWRANHYLDFLKRADIVIVSYTHVRDDLIKYFNIPKEKIKVLLLPMHNLWFSKFLNSKVYELDKYSLPSKYLLYPANTWKHKNHIRLAEAVARVKDLYKIEINIVCTGHLNDNFEKIEERVLSLGIEKQIIFTNIVTEYELYSFYQTCCGVVIPTTYEAGSFPLYESILLDKQVICSNVTSLPETIGSNEFTFNPFDVEDMSEKILALWIDDDFRSKNTKQIRKEADNIKNNDALPIINEIYKILITS